MAELYGVYKCNVCGNVVRMNLAGGGDLVCCEQPMVLERPKTAEEGKEKHLPVVEMFSDEVKINCPKCGREITLLEECRANPV